MPLPALPPDDVIARSTPMRPMEEVARDAGLGPGEVEQLGRGKAKVELSVLERARGGRQGRLVLVTAMTPTPSGEGKTLTSIGLAQAMGRLGIGHLLCLRQPSLGPTFGIKGGAAGGGYAQVQPAAEINLHYTGDFHAITTAHNLLAACTDNTMHFGNALGIERVTWRRVMDLCDRQLREVEAGLGGKANGWPHRTGFDITAAGEVMAALAMAGDEADLRARLARMVVGYRADGSPVLAREVGCIDALMLLLKDAMRPNLAQTLEGTPALIHAGPFGNIAHGCNSVIATRMALGLADYVVTEAGFGADLGAEKFLDIKCRVHGLAPSAAVLVVSCRALRYHGMPEGADYRTHNTEHARAGIENARVHLENLRNAGLPVVVAANRFADDPDEELRLVEELARKEGCRFAMSEAAARGGAGAEELAREVVAAAAPGPVCLRHPYSLEEPLRARIESLARSVYRAEGVDFDEDALASMRLLESAGFGELPLCVAKSQGSLSDDGKKRGAPRGWRLRVRDLSVRAGAGYIVVLAGKMVLMPGLPERSRALDAGPPGPAAERGVDTPKAGRDQLAACAGVPVVTGAARFARNQG